MGNARWFRGALLSVLFFVWPSGSAAQTDGCSLGLTRLGLPEAIQHRLDDLLLKACYRHDNCWRSPGTCEAPTTFRDKAMCDLWFLADLKGVCMATSIAMAAAGSSQETVDDFREDCTAGALLAYTGVSLNLRDYAIAQCVHWSPMPSGIHHLGYSPSCSEPMCLFLADNATDPVSRQGYLKKAASCCRPLQNCPDPHIAWE